MSSEPALIQKELVIPKIVTTGCHVNATAVTRQKNTSMCTLTSLFTWRRSAPVLRKAIPMSTRLRLVLIALQTVEIDERTTKMNTNAMQMLLKIMKILTSVFLKIKG